jgi:excinuclease ABC subunit B
VILYADRLTGSITRALGETNRRRAKQVAYNAAHGITPQTIVKAIADYRQVLGLQVSEKDVKEILKLELNAETHDLETVLKKKDEEMKEAARNLEFELAAILRDETIEINKELKKRQALERAKKKGGPRSATLRMKKRPRHGRTH